MSLISLGLTREETLMLLGKLSTDQQEDFNAAMSDSTLALLMSLLYGIDARVLDLEDSEAWISRVPILNDRTFIPDVNREIMSDTRWLGCHGIKAVVQFAWAISLHQLSSYINLDDLVDCIDGFIDYAISCNVFSNIRNFILTNKNFFQEEDYVRKLHHLITDFIVQMPIKVKEMRSQADESSRIIIARQQENLDIPDNLPKDFQHFMDLIHDLYSYDPLNLMLSNEYWCSSDAMMNQQQQSSSSFNSSFHASQAAQRQVTLFKFIRLAGDMLTPPLYLPYINMLAGLSSNPQSAHCCFNLLKLNAATTGSHASIVSWDHFCTSLNNYYTNLKLEFGEGPHHHFHHQQHQPSMYGHRHVISQQEVDGLMGVLKLISIVVQKDEIARIALSRSNRGNLITVVFGLISCPVPLKLKAALLNVLSSFVASPEVAVDIWQMFEESQIFQTQGPNGTLVKGGLQVELDENEPKMEEYSMTCAFILFLSALSRHPLPSILAGGSNAGFLPVLEFLKNSIFLKCNSRSYKHPEEKWEICARVLEVFHRLVDNHEIGSVDVRGGPTAPDSNSPGYVLLLHLYNDTNFLKMILYLIDDSIQIFEKFSPVADLPFVKTTSLLCLKIIEVALKKQDKFMERCMQVGGASVMVGAGLDKLLMGINPRTSKSDHLVNLAKFVLCNNELPNHALNAIKIFTYLTQSSYVQTKIVGILSANDEFARELLCGFSECLESDDVEVDLEHPGADPSSPSSETRVQLRESVLNLLLESLDRPTPNMAHFLCGFDVKRYIHKTSLQDPGLDNFPKTCIHSIISILNKFLEEPQDTSHILYPRFYELAYHFIHSLCTNILTYVPILRYLRSHDFLYKQSMRLPFVNQGDFNTNSSTSSLTSSLLTQQSWLLRSLVVDLKVSSGNKQRSYVQRIIDLLTGDGNELCRSNIWEASFKAPRNQNKLQLLLSSSDFTLDPTPSINLTIFNQSQVEQVASMCEVVTDKNLTLCDVKTLYKILINECSGLIGPLASRKERALEEINEICANLVHRNACKREANARKQAFVAWRQAVEILLTAVPTELLAGERRQQLILELLQSLLHKLNSDQITDLSSQASCVILILISNLTRCFISDQTFNHMDGQHDAQYDHHHDVSVLSLGNEVAGMRSTFFTSLQAVLDALLRYLLNSASQGQKMRVHIYSSLLYFMQIADKPRDVRTSLHDAFDRNLQKHLSSKDNEYDKLCQANMNTIKKYSDSLLSCLCRDACDGHDVTKMLSMSVLNKILSKDTQHMWLNEMSTQGYVQHITNSLVADDNQLKQLLTPKPTPLKALFIFQSKISLLTRMARTNQGANMLMTCDVMSHLSNCSVLSMRPMYEEERAGGSMGFIPSMLSRYRHHILFPILRLSLTLISSIGTDNAAITKIFLFVMTHMDIFTNILSDQPHLRMTMEALRELQLTTALLASIIQDGVVEEVVLLDVMYGDVKMCMNRLQRLLISILTRFSISGHRKSKLLLQIKENFNSGCNNDDGDCYGDVGGVVGDAGASRSMSSVTDVESKVMIMVEEILSNALTLCKNLIIKSSSSGTINVIFTPQLCSGIEQKRFSTFSDYDLPSSKSSSSSPCLGVIVQLLLDSCHHYLTCLDVHGMLNKKYNNIQDLSPIDIKELCIQDDEMMDMVSLNQRNTIIANKLAVSLELKAREIQLLAYIIETGLLLLWRHLEFYLVICQTVNSVVKQSQFDKGYSYLNSTWDPTCTSDTTHLGMGLSHEDLNVLKKEAITWINESFFKGLLEVDQDQTRNPSMCGFISALVRRLKRIVTFHASTNRLL